MNDDTSIIRAAAEAWERCDREMLDLARKAVASGKRLLVSLPRLAPGAEHRAWSEADHALVFDYQVVDVDAEVPAGMRIITPEIVVEARRRLREGKGGARR